MVQCVGVYSVRIGRAKKMITLSSTNTTIQPKMKRVKMSLRGKEGTRVGNRKVRLVITEEREEMSMRTRRFNLDWTGKACHRQLELGKNMATVRVIWCTRTRRSPLQLKGKHGFNDSIDVQGCAR